MQIMRKKALLTISAMLFMVAILPAHPVSAVAWGVQEGVQYQYRMTTLRDAGNNIKSSTWFYTQSVGDPPINATEGDVWTWETSTITTFDIQGVFRTSGGFVNDFIVDDDYDNIRPDVLPVTPFFKLEDWAAQGADWSNYQTVGLIARYSDSLFYMEIDTTRGLLVGIYFNDIGSGGDTEMIVELINMADLPPAPTTATSGTSTPAAGSPAGSDDIGGVIAGILTDLGIGGITADTVNIIILIVVFAAVIIGIMWYRNRQMRGRRVMTKKHPVFRKTKKQFKNISKKLGLK